ncbi:MAG: hypothetical protein A2Z39_05540 [Deltaproteobacteria bacterium RBG_19FT_COMBO_46_9]|nr:MAG: hypothetical protein A2Z39_05540 [Deltaproteobacteria bacterium RBG_19FT_COMBO_46_9]
MSYQKEGFHGLSPIPFCIRIFYQVDIIVAGVSCYILSNPIRFFELLIFALELQLGNNQSLVFREEFVNFPNQASLFNPIPVFLY